MLIQKQVSSLIMEWCTQMCVSGGLSVCNGTEKKNRKEWGSTVLTHLTPVVSLVHLSLSLSLSLSLCARIKRFHHQKIGREILFPRNLHIKSLLTILHYHRHYNGWLQRAVSVVLFFSQDILFLCYVATSHSRAGWLLRTSLSKDFTPANFQSNSYFWRTKSRPSLFQTSICLIQAYGRQGGVMWVTTKHLVPLPADMSHDNWLTLMDS